MPRNDLNEQPIRMADLYCGEGRATKAALLAGMEVVYAYEPVAHARGAYARNTGFVASGELGPVSMTNAPEFDFLMVNLPAAACLSESVLSQALRLARERRPEAIVIEGQAPRTDGDTVALGEVCRNLEDMGYYVCWRPKLGDDFTDSPRAWRTVIIATLKQAVFVWPDEVGYEGDDEPENIQAAMPREGRPSLLLLALMAAVYMVLRGPVVVDVLVPHFA